ncbi:hypothetical protein [Leptospira sp. GIMC2001]|uniref:hypothetical protein n=1 Tax=Leptospira sp. GIMC2001 TaxID=1513297 RepID=UPI0023491F93|nr:hypothetical protein [Leptospira sp. GIMC2001]WCL51457.1 hypothetical protein O4O04_20285 [Leptospira sp. GIMC2001]
MMTTTENQLLMETGEINPSAYQNKFEEKLDALQTLFPREKYNMVLFSQFLMNCLPANVVLKPQIVTVTKDDIWDERNAEGVGLKKGHVMLKSEKVIGIGQAVGIKLDKVTDKTIEIGGVAHLLIEYVASLDLPDGTPSITPPTGKALPILTSSGKNQAHVHESCDRKAKRNAIKELLQIPTQLPLEQAMKMWVCMKAVYKDDDGGFSANKIKTINAQATQATTLLFDDKGPTYDELLSEIEKAESKVELESILAKVNNSKFESVFEDSLRHRMNLRHRHLAENAKTKGEPKL